VSILFGAAVIVLTYITSLMLFSNRRRALVAAVLLAFLPGFVFHTSVVSYESLGATLTALFLLVGIKAIKQPRHWCWWLILGILAGLAITTKYSAVLLPVEIIFMVWLANWAGRRNGQSKKRVRTSLARLGIAAVALVVAVSWWFGFVVWYFNKVAEKGWVVGILEPLMVRDATDSASVTITAGLFGQANVSADVPVEMIDRNYPELARITIDSFWAGPINGHYILSPWLAILFSVIALVGIIGLWRAWQRAARPERVWLALLLFQTLLIFPLLAIRLIFSVNPLEVSQGRHILMPATSAIAILLVWGWDQWHQKLGQVVVAGLLVWSVWGQIGGAILFQPSPVPVWDNQSPQVDQSVTATNKILAGKMQLLATDWQVIPAGDALEVLLWWQSLGEMGEDYLIELRLLDQNNQLASYSVGHPAQGRYRTRAWEPGDVIKDVYGLPLVDVPAGSYRLELRLINRDGRPVPETTMVSLGQVDLDTVASPSNPCVVWFQGQPRRQHLFLPPYNLDSTFIVISSDTPKLAARSGLGEEEPWLSEGIFHVFMVGPAWEKAYDLVVNSTVCQQLVFDLPPREFALPKTPHQLETNFNNQVMLLGYDLPVRRIQPGERLPLTLYWRALDYIGQDYQIFDNLLDNQQNRWGGYDRRARDGYSTLLWVPGEVITDAFGVPVDPAAPPGIYTLDIGLYLKTEDGANSLPLVVDGQPSAQTGVRLGPIKVGGAPSGILTTDPQPQVALNQSLGNGQLVLLGYDSVPGTESLQLTFYWRVITPLFTDYTTFVHLRDGTNQNITQKDSPPAGGLYPTSLWDSGEVIVDTISLPLAGVSPGIYTPVVGLYDFVTGQRLPVKDNSANEILLETIEIP
jgi:hypothetical protein